MKRIANDVAIQTILYFMRGDQRIRVVDYSNEHEMWRDETPDWSVGKAVFDGRACDMGSIVRGTREQYLASRSKCRGMKAWVDPNTGNNIIIFQICTTFEQY